MIWAFAKIHEIRGESGIHSQSRIHYPTRRRPPRSLQNTGLKKTMPDPQHLIAQCLLGASLA
jgi:hypothetical protein